MNRREVLKRSAAILGAGIGWEYLGRPKPRFRLGACDWSIGPRLNPQTFDIARKIGLQGLQVSYNTNKDEAGLSNPETLNAIREASTRTGIKIAGLAIGELNRVPYKSEARTEEWVWKSVDAAKALGASVILLAFFGNGELRDDPAGQKEVIERLKRVAPHAERQKITLGIESYLSARDHLKIIDAVGSKAIKVYYDSRNSADAGHDIYEEIPLLGKDLICELHMKENGFRLGEGTIDWPRVAMLLKKVGYQGWMQIEGATPQGADVVECYQHNRRYLETIFPFS
ncbi:TIM barrel protein [Cytophagaceae bacterium SJW1-29]|uniref:TIM barrel protein n=1 Tax=Salmonirosea aquatica TaxID=2654236 RepID=A0A7C9F701_9BACT|nr:TIM barrel protein [Cytophagaceae bacterium SJW1-29]